MFERVFGRKKDKSIAPQETIPETGDVITLLETLIGLHSRRSPAIEILHQALTAHDYNPDYQRFDDESSLRRFIGAHASRAHQSRYHLYTADQALFIVVHPSNKKLQPWVSVANHCFTSIIYDQPRVSVPDPRRFFWKQFPLTVNFRLTDQYDALTDLENTNGVIVFDIVNAPIAMIVNGKRVDPVDPKSLEKPRSASVYIPIKAAKDTWWDERWVGNWEVYGFPIKIETGQQGLLRSPLTLPGNTGPT